MKFWKLEFWKLNLEIEVLKIKFRNWSFFFKIKNQDYVWFLENLKKNYEGMNIEKKKVKKIKIII